MTRKVLSCVTAAAVAAILASAAHADVVTTTVFTEGFEGASNVFNITPVDLTGLGYSNTSYAATYTSENFGRLGTHFNIPITVPQGGYATITIQYSVAVASLPTTGAFISRPSVEISGPATDSSGDTWGYGGSGGNWVAFRPDGSADFAESNNGFGSKTVDPNISELTHDWVYSYTFDQSFTLTYLELQFWSDNTSEIGTAYIDNVSISVSITEVPEPASLAALGLGGALLLGLRRKNA